MDRMGSGKKMKNRIVRAQDDLKSGMEIKGK